MTIQRTGNLTNSLRTQYTEEYLGEVEQYRLYDQFSMDLLRTYGGDISRGATVQFEFLSDMTHGTTSLSEVYDINPQTLTDETATVTVDMYGEAIQVSEKLMIQVFTDYGAARSRKVGKNMIETVDYYAQQAALQGGLYQRTATIRAEVDAGTTTHRATDDMFWYISARLSNLKCPGWVGQNKAQSWACITDPFVAHDIVTGGDVVSVAQYQKGEMILSQEIGRLGPFRIISSGQAKIFYGAGTANATDVDTTLSSAATALSKTIVVAAADNIAAGQWLNIIAAQESGNTYYPTNERVKVQSISGTTVTIVGEGDNGGLRFAHASGTVVNHNDSVHTLAFGGPQSIVKVYAPSVGVYGRLVGPLKQGLLEQWESLGWKWYGGYGRPVEKYLYRAEVGVEEEA